MITSPADERFLTSSVLDRSVAQTTVRAKFWGDHDGVALHGSVRGQNFSMVRVDDSQVWQASLPAQLEDGVHELVVTAQPKQGDPVKDRIRFRVGAVPPCRRESRDQDNAFAAWPERGLLGTQLGPNKNGKQW